MEAAVVTILSTGIAGSASLFDRSGDESADAVRREHFAGLRAAIQEAGGREVRSTGDGLVAVFASAVGAVRCAAAMQRRARDRPVPLTIGLDAGEPIPDGEDLYGTPLVVAERLCRAAGAREVVASEVVCQLAGARISEPTRPVGAWRLAGISAKVNVHQVLWDEPAGLPVGGSPPVGALDIVIADDQQLVRAGFRVILEDAGFRVVGEAADGAAAIDTVLRTRPDVVLMDIRMPEIDGLQAAARILEAAGNRTAVLMLTTFDLDEYVYEALRIGASGFILKDAPADQLIEAIRAAATGDAVLAPSVTRRLIEAFVKVRSEVPPGTPAALSDLTHREVEVLRLIAQGLSNAEVAAALFLTENTIKTHVARLLAKLGVRDRVQAVVLAYESGLVGPGSLARATRRPTSSLWAIPAASFPGEARGSPSTTDLRHTMSHRIRHTAIGLTGLAALAGVVAFPALTGAQGADRTITLNMKVKSGGVVTHHAVKAGLLGTGDSQIVRLTMTAPGGGQVGTAYSECVNLGPKARPETATLHCTQTYDFKDGQVVTAGIVKFSELDGLAIPIVGGSGAYRGASGQVTGGAPAKGFDSVDVLSLDS